MTKKVLQAQFKAVRGWVSKEYDETDQSLIDIVPAGFNNNLHWQFGHVVSTMEGELVRLLGKNDADKKRLQKSFGYGTSPDNFDDDTPSFDDLKALLDKQVEDFSFITSSALEKELDQPMLNQTNSCNLLGVFIAHEAMHAGKIQEMKRLLEAQY